MDDPGQTVPHTAGLIQHKISVPDVPERLVSRPRIETALGALIERRQVVLVLATAGAGKTTAISQATARLPHPVAWLSVDATDARPGRLLAYLEDALAQHAPAAHQVATRALRAGIQHTESAGLLAESLRGHTLVLVLDNLERLGVSGEGWEALGSFLHYLPRTVRAVLVSRRDIPSAVHRQLDPTSVAALREEDLAFTVEEAADALRLGDNATIDPAEAVSATGGWVTGVLFEAWRSEEHTAVVGGEADPLHGYISSRILAELPDVDREFLVTAAILDEVTAERARALGLDASARRMQSLRSVRLPVVWSRDGRTMRCHPRLREFLLEQLGRRDDEELRRIRLAHGRLLADEGHDEEATEVLLQAGEAAEARVCGARVIRRVIERLDLPVAERWLEAFGPADREPHELTTARLMLAWARDDYRGGVAIADALNRAATRDEVARASERAAALMIYCYAQCGRPGDVDEILRLAGPGAEVAAVRYSLGTMYPSYRIDTPPELTGGPFDACVLFAKYWFGHLGDLDISLESHWGTSLATPWQIAALRAQGHTRRALELYERTRDSLSNSMSLHAVVPELLLDAGRPDEAITALEEGRRLARHAGAHIWYLGFTEGLVRLRILDRRDPTVSMALLDGLDNDPLIEHAVQLSAKACAWRGWLLLRGGSADADALGCLREAVSLMKAGGLFLELPIAAVLLAEAEWRAGHEDEADRAADLALEVSGRQGSHHVLLQVLAEFPAVVSRRIDAEAETDTRWHAIGRALAAQGATIQVMERTPAVRVMEFGRHTLLVDGVEARLRISKSLELLSYLSSRPGLTADRPRVLEALFARDDRSTRAYLRQAVHQLNLALPPQLRLTVEQNRLCLAEEVAQGCQSLRMEADLAAAHRLTGRARLSAVEALLARNEGDYLPDRTSQWAEERRRVLSRRAADALSSAADLALRLHQYGDAVRLCEQATTIDPLREVAWRVRMRAANALGDDDGVLTAFQRCETALARIDATPSPSTRRLLKQLQR
ncbi:BTAD domain-containing putative transcriptional regulator [Streptomyces sp. SID12488]|uniref:BTAD domain-containing putative transcriptional regulator n=1 Tax=Streptomyces sp. SID12488 TaxID=2706040 RepID=UPI0013D99576|nr:BTAD domain-containing putative transcriptional regulator [Streptomyces sp. SID12488]NEA67053.1 transcriptional activator domain protein [Streptomyces sp. SID12488]